MTVPFESPGFDKLVLPPNMEGLLDTALVPADELNAKHRDTEKYYVVGHPDLFVRVNRGENPEDVGVSLDSTSVLRGRGINVLPYKMLEHDGQAYVVTKRVEGVDLLETLKTNPTAELLANVDQTWTALLGAESDARESGLRMPADIDSAGQYMLGTIGGDSADQAPKLWLVDLPVLSFDISDNYFANIILLMANNVV